MANGAPQQQQQNDWPSTVVALGILGLVGAIACTAILHYNTVDDALKIWTGLTALVGVITGAFVSYFFTRGTVQAASQSAQAAQQAVQTTQESLQTAQETAQNAQQNAMAQSNALSAALSHVSDPEVLSTIHSDPVVDAALKMS